MCSEKQLGEMCQSQRRCYNHVEWAYCEILVIAGIMKRLQLLKWRLQDDVEDQEHHARDSKLDYKMQSLDCKFSMKYKLAFVVCLWPWSVLRRYSSTASKVVLLVNKVTGLCAPVSWHCIKISTVVNSILAAECLS